jgi:parallel beta-helix repeat protein
MAAAEQLYVDESGWWREACAFNASGAPIQAAVDAAAAGDSIYVWNGSYIENVDVDTPRLTLEGEGADVVTVTAADSGDHVFEVADVNYMNISGFALRGATDHEMAGIRLFQADYCNISGDNVYGNRFGIYIVSSSGNTLANNTANSNIWRGIYLSSSSNNTLANNTANLSYYGIYLSFSNNNTLTNNIVNSNIGRGICLSSSSNNTLTNNNANSNNYYGIWLRSSSNHNTLTNNNASNNPREGIRLYNADNNNITCNWVQNNTWWGFCLVDGSTGNTIEHNNIIENGNYNATSGGWEWQFYTNQYQSVEAKHNYWGTGMNSSTIDASIHDDEEGGWGEVEFYPFETEPVSCVPTPDEPPAFTTADAVTRSISQPAAARPTRHWTAAATAASHRSTL